ncbi:succinate dehydrogenase, hydrophobic membrane anchor protein [Sulfitobacter sp. LCG007]
MSYLTDRKRATGLGSAKSGTAHHWSMTVSSVALLVLVPLFLFTFGSILGAPYQEIVDYYSRPFPAVVAALTFAVGFKHLVGGMQIMLEDYVHGLTGRIAIIAATCICYAALAAALFALVRLAL